MRVGFTGTRDGMTGVQYRRVWQALCDLIGGDTRLDVEVHHGECVGADEQFHKIALELGARVVGHPCNIPAMRASVTTHESMPVAPPLTRNVDIVESVDVLIAAPREMVPQWRGGTWYTWRYACSRARSRKRYVILVFPDGRVEETNAPCD